MRKKNRKLRRLRELYPGIRIKLFYARDFRALMLKFGKLALHRRPVRDQRPGRARPARGRRIAAAGVARRRVATVERDADAGAGASRRAGRRDARSRIAARMADDEARRGERRRQARRRRRRRSIAAHLAGAPPR